MCVCVCVSVPGSQVTAQCVGKLIFSLWIIFKISLLDFTRLCLYHYCATQKLERKYAKEDAGTDSVWLFMKCQHIWIQMNEPIIQFSCSLVTLDKYLWTLNLPDTCNLVFKHTDKTLVQISCWLSLVKIRKLFLSLNPLIHLSCSEHDHRSRLFTG